MQCRVSRVLRKKVPMGKTLGQQHEIRWVDNTCSRSYVCVTRLVTTKKLVKFITCELTLTTTIQAPPQPVDLIAKCGLSPSSIFYKHLLQPQTSTLVAGRYRWGRGTSVSRGQLQQRRIGRFRWHYWMHDCNRPLLPPPGHQS